MRYIVMVMVLVLSCFDLSAAQFLPDQRESLRGLPGVEVEVVIDDINTPAQADGLKEEAIQTAVELILRSSGIRILTLSEFMMTPTRPYLYVQVGALKSGSLYSLGVIVSLRQLVSFVERPQHTMYATTWLNAGVELVGQNKLRDIISGSIEPKVKEFANDFLAVNPR